MPIYKDVNTLFLNLHPDTPNNVSRADLEDSLEYLSEEDLLKARNSKGMTLLYAAITSGNLEVAQYLLEIDKKNKKVNDVNLANVISNTGSNALHAATNSEQPNIELIRNLILHGANAWVENVYKDSPLKNLRKKAPPKDLNTTLGFLVDRHIDKIRKEKKGSSDFVIDDNGNLSYKIGNEEFNMLSKEFLDSFAADELGNSQEWKSYFEGKQPPYNPFVESIFHSAQLPKKKELPKNRILSYTEWLHEEYGVSAMSERNTLQPTFKSGINYVFSDKNKKNSFAEKFSSIEHRFSNGTTFDPVHQKSAVLLEGDENVTLKNEYSIYLKKMKEQVPRSAKEILDQLKEIETAENGIEKIDKIDMVPKHLLPADSSRQHIVGGARLDEFKDLASDKKTGGYYNFKATSAYKLSIEAYLALNKDSLSPTEYFTLKKASLSLMGDDGDTKKGLKADTNWVSYIKEFKYSVEGDRLYFIRTAIEKDADDLLNGNPKRQNIDWKVKIPISSKDLKIDTMRDNMTEKTEKDPRIIPRFFPDEKGESQTDSIIIQTGGMRGHSTMVKIWKQGVDSKGKPVTGETKPDYYKFYRTEYNAGAGTKEIDPQGTCQAIYTTEIKPNWDGTKQITPPEPPSKEYNDYMSSTIKRLLIAEREILFFSQPESNVVVGHNEPTAKEKEEAEQWNKRNEIIKVCSGKKVKEFCRLGIIQRSGNCTMASQRQMLRDHFEKGKDSVIEDHWAFAQTYGSDSVKDQLAEKKKELNAELVKVNTELLKKLLTEYENTNPKNGDWSKDDTSKWEIGKGNSGFVYLANSNYHFSIEKKSQDIKSEDRKILCFKKDKETKSMQKIDDMPQIEIPQSFITFVNDKIAAAKKAPQQKVEPLPDSLQRKIFNNTELLKELLTAYQNLQILEYGDNIKETEGKWKNPIVDTDKPKDPGRDWLIGRGNKPYNTVGLRFEEYHFELDKSGKLICKNMMDWEKKIKLDQVLGKIDIPKSIKEFIEKRTKEVKALKASQSVVEQVSAPPHPVLVSMPPPPDLKPPEATAAAVTSVTTDPPLVTPVTKDPIPKIVPTPAVHPPSVTKVVKQPPVDVTIVKPESKPKSKPKVVSLITTTFDNIDIDKLYKDTQVTRPNSFLPVFQHWHRWKQISDLKKILNTIGDIKKPKQAKNFLKKLDEKTQSILEEIKDEGKFRGPSRLEQVVNDLRKDIESINKSLGVNKQKSASTKKKDH